MDKSILKEKYLQKNNRQAQYLPCLKKAGLLKSNTTFSFNIFQKTYIRITFSYVLKYRDTVTNENIIIKILLI